MRILLGNNHLQNTGGTENYTYTLALELKRLGHDVEYFAFDKGEVSESLEREGIRYMSGKWYDLILANHNTVVEHIHSYGFLIQTCHGTVPQLEQPSKLADRIVSVTDEVRDYVSGLGFESSVIYNGIDCERFSPKRPLSGKLTSVLSLCQSDELNQFIKDCCTTAGVAFMACNKYTDNIWNIENKINEADLVVGIGRSLYDGMACGRCVLSFDKRTYMDESVGDGYINAGNMDDSIRFNCSGRYLRRTFTSEEFRNELMKYDPADGEWARNYALENLNICKVAGQYLSIYDEWKRGRGCLLGFRIRKFMAGYGLFFK